LHELLNSDGIVHMTTTKSDTDKEWMFPKNDYDWSDLDLIILKMPLRIYYQRIMVLNC
jgi:hypothetical protein